MKLKIKRGDEVAVIAGAHKGGRGKILEIEPRRMRVLVEGVNLRKRHQRKSEQAPEGGIIEKESPIHYSNVVKVERGEGKAGKTDKPDDADKATPKATKKAAEKAAEKTNEE